MSNSTKWLPIGKIRADRETQTRAALNEETVVEYAAHIASAEKFPPLVVFHDGTTFWLADGFHRLAANKKHAVSTGTDSALDEVECVVEDGGKWDAIRFGLIANVRHGMRRTNADKRRAVELLLSDPINEGASDRAIADQAWVSHPFVAEVRNQLVTVSSSPPEQVKRVGRDGKARKLPERKPAATGDAEDDPVAVRLAQEYGVTPSKILIDARYAGALDRIAEHPGGADVRAAILSRRVLLQITDEAISAVEQLDDVALSKLVQILADDMDGVGSVARGLELYAEHCETVSPCGVCGSIERDDDGECAQCHDPTPDEPFRHRAGKEPDHPAGFDAELKQAHRQLAKAREFVLSMAAVEEVERLAGTSVKSLKQIKLEEQARQISKARRLVARIRSELKELQAK